ncbi:MAG: GNAT family acetyltransferase [Candidatus Eisenbacteria bacterium]|nr:GNAT family acetyltransferase [Candidatus Eisenbacteria bacterium]
MEIREFLESDEEPVLRLWNECGLVVPWNDPHRDILRKLKVQRELFLVGCCDGEVVATAMVGYNGHRGWVNYLAVSPKCRRKGYGREMMDAAEARLKKLGCPKINLQVRSGNAEAVGFYERIGYKRDDVVSFGKRLETDD